MNHSDQKEKALRDSHTLNPHPKAVRDENFRSGGEFFDPRDFVQVKYEMLRRVSQDGVPVSQAARGFGLSRPSFYQAQADFLSCGLPGLLPEKPGPRRAHKMTDQVLSTIDTWLAEEPTLVTTELAERLRKRLGLVVHPRSIERALRRREKKGHSK